MAHLPIYQQQRKDPFPHRCFVIQPLRDGRTDGLGAFAVLPGGGKHHQLRPGFLNQFPAPDQALGRNPVVPVHKEDIFPFSGQKARLSGPDHPLVGLVNHPHPAVPGGVGVTQPRSRVRRAVVHQNQLKVPTGLGQNAVHAGRQIPLHLIHRNNNRKKHFLSYRLK